MVEGEATVMGLEVSTRLRKKTRLAARDAVIKWSTNQPL